MRTTRALAVAAALGGCLELPDEPGSNLVTQDVDSANGRSLNGKSLNGTSLNGTSLNGKSLNGTALKSANPPGLPLSGASLVGSQWTGQLSNTESVPLRIDAALRGTGSNADLWFYAISYQTSAGWMPLCGRDAANAPIYAVTVSGVFDATATWGPAASQFTIACRGKAIAKCIELGYKPWKNLGPYLQTCTRLLRADYCGTGVSHTVDGTLINVFDSAGIQTDTEGWTPEAEWGPTGARCVRSSTAARYHIDAAYEPRCKSPPASATCAKGFGSGTLMIDELSPSALTAIESGQ